MIPCSLIKSRTGYLFEIWIIYFNTKSECVFSKACHLKNHKRNHKNRLIFLNYGTANMETSEI